MPAAQPDRPTLEQVQIDLRAACPFSSGSSGPNLLPRPDAGYAGLSGGDGTISDTSLSAIVVVPELLPEVLGWSRNLFHVAAIDVADLQHAALHDHPVEELIRRLALPPATPRCRRSAARWAWPIKSSSKRCSTVGRRALLEEIRGQRQENFLIVGPRKIGKTSLLQRVRFELERQGYRVIPRGMDYTTSPSSRELLKAMISELWEDIDPMRAAAGFALGETLPPCVRSSISGRIASRIAALPSCSTKSTPSCAPSAAPIYWASGARPGRWGRLWPPSCQSRRLAATISWPR